MDVAVVGLGHLGLPLAAVFAAAGHRVFGADCDRGRLHRINQNDVAWCEPGLGALLRNTGLSLQLTDDVSTAVEVSDISIVVVPTPSAQDGSYDDRHVLEAVEAIGAALRRHDHRHTVVIASTVIPGAVGDPIARRLQETNAMRASAFAAAAAIIGSSVINSVGNPKYHSSKVSKSRIAGFTSTRSQ